MANNWAIVAGINDYDFLPDAPLKFAVADAMAMRSFLCDEVGFKSDQVLFCGDGTAGSKRATVSVLRDILLNQIQRAKNADNLWFFFSGHGIAERLMPIDGNPMDLNMAIPIHFVTDCLRKCNAKNIVLVLDMCRSEGRDPDERNVGSIEGELRELVKQRDGQQGIITLFSCGRGESSYEVAPLGQGAFTYALLEGLRKTTIVKDLERHLAERVPELHRIHASDKRRKQVPLVIPEPGWKYHEPILSSHATEGDVARLKEMAIDAEIEEGFGEAKRLLRQIVELSDVKSQRMDALKAIDRIDKKIDRQNASSEAVYHYNIHLEQGSTYIAPPTSPVEKNIQYNVNFEENSSFITQPQENPINAIALNSEKGVDYRKLRDLLKAGQWEDADQETFRVMLQVTNRPCADRVDFQSLKIFPCKDLKTIDQLWVTASAGHFGLSIQKKIWEDCGSPRNSGKNWDQLCVRVGWQNKERTAYRYSDSHEVQNQNLKPLYREAFRKPFRTSRDGERLYPYVTYSDLKFNPSLSFEGELPAVWTNLWSSESWVKRNDWLILFSRAKTCEL
jgi:GUN4-like/Caspase domain